MHLGEDHMWAQRASEHLPPQEDSPGLDLTMSAPYLKASRSVINACGILKKINPEYSLEGLMLKLKLQNSGHLMQRADSLEKLLMLGKIEGRGGAKMAEE